MNRATLAVLVAAVTVLAAGCAGFTRAGPTTVRVSGNATVPDTTYVLERPSVRRVGPGQYVPPVSSREEPEKQRRDFLAQARYTATVRLPATEEGQLTVRHDGVNVTGVGWGPSGPGSEARRAVVETLATGA